MSETNEEDIVVFHRNTLYGHGSGSCNQSFLRYATITSLLEVGPSSASSVPHRDHPLDEETFYEDRQKDIIKSKMEIRANYQLNQDVSMTFRVERKRLKEYSNLPKLTFSLFSFLYEYIDNIPRIVRKSHKIYERKLKLDKKEKEREFIKTLPFKNEEYKNLKKEVKLKKSLSLINPGGEANPDKMFCFVAPATPIVTPVLARHPKRIFTSARPAPLSTSFAPSPDRSITSNGPVDVIFTFDPGGGIRVIISEFSLNLAPISIAEVNVVCRGFISEDRDI